MFPYNLLPETPGINAVNNKKAGLMSHEAQTPATPPKYISKSSHTSIPVPLHISDSPTRTSTQPLKYPRNCQSLYLQSFAVATGTRPQKVV